MKLHKLTMVYLGVAVSGLLITWFFFIQYLLAGGSFVGDAFFYAAMANPVTTAITIDVYLSAVVFSIWLFGEARKYNIRWPWLYVVLTFALGLTFSFPLFLAVRQQRLHYLEVA